MPISKKSRLSLDSIYNPQCKKCSKEQRSTDDGLCQDVSSIIDAGKVRCVGPWAEEKIYYLTQYFSAFSISMKNSWNSINYIEICSGPGRCINRENGTEFNGTPLSIIDTNGFKHIDNALFFDYNPSVVDTLNFRFKNRGIQNARAVIGNYMTSSIIESIKAQIPKNGLTLVFIDPTDLSIPFEFIKQIKSYLNKMDLMINIAVGTDFNRNVKNAITKPGYQLTYQKYVTFLGSNEFLTDERTISLAELGNQDQSLRNSFRQAYQKNLSKLGFNYFGTELVRHYYDILYASAHERGIHLWKDVNKIEFDGQRKLF